MTLVQHSHKGPKYKMLWSYLQLVNCMCVFSNYQISDRYCKERITSVMKMFSSDHIYCVVIYMKCFSSMIHNPLHTIDAYSQQKLMFRQTLPGQTYQVLVSLSCSVEEQIFGIKSCTEWFTYMGKILTHNHKN